MSTRTKNRVSVKVDSATSMTLFVFDCPSCGIVFGIPNDYDESRRSDHRDFYCPNGHRMSYGESDTESELRRAKELLARREQQLASTSEDVRAARAAAEVERRSAAAYKGHITRLKNRVGKGKCPACSTTFDNIAEHMAHEHPGYGDDSLKEGDA